MESNNNQAEISDAQDIAAPSTTTVFGEQQTTKATGTKGGPQSKDLEDPVLVSTPTNTNPPDSGGYTPPMIPGTDTGTYEPPGELYQRTTPTTLVSIVSSSGASSNSNLRRSGGPLSNPAFFGSVMLIVFLWSLFWIFWTNNNLFHYIDH
eukprot:CAMPEP_0185741004 /NCGR_PEP_ID=MMETSP1171-20130828/38721_1 /TAXON_ID=374046 /ORGANISM="Helicotheca tamensis, Strain CCMP826" /LENGTH=149 /DNA_ID=CAMNT_0028412941 /DNA_START=436 /DNA_END=885 /DNA_ORIENTATION=+